MRTSAARAAQSSRGRRYSVRPETATLGALAPLGLLARTWYQYVVSLAKPVFV